MRLIDKNCKRCNGKGGIYGHAPLGENESWDCGCGFEYKTSEDVESIKKRINAEIKRMKSGQHRSEYR